MTPAQIHGTLFHRVAAFHFLCRILESSNGEACKQQALGCQGAFERNSGQRFQKMIRARNGV